MSRPTHEECEERALKLAKDIEVGDVLAGNRGERRGVVYHVQQLPTGDLLFYWDEGNEVRWWGVFRPREALTEYGDDDEVGLR